MRGLCNLGERSLMARCHKCPIVALLGLGTKPWATSRARVRCLNGLHLYARALQLGGTVVNGTVSQVPNSGPIGFGDQALGNLASAGQLDQWTFFARAGQYYTVLVDPGTDTGVSPYLGYVQVQVLNTNGQVIASATNAASGAKGFQEPAV